jgi:phosphoribosylaminoimidazole-succinocarboxamide synthase
MLLDTSRDLEGNGFPLKKLWSGKVRECYDLDQDKILIVVTDRLSAFDVVMKNSFQDKGTILNKLSTFWMQKVSSILPNHIITDCVDEYPEILSPWKEQLRNRSVIVKKLCIFPIEVIVRGYITGSGWKDYQQTGKLCGIILPPGLKHGQKLAKPIFTPSTKAAHGSHDENITHEEAIALIGEQNFEKIKSLAIDIYNMAYKYAIENANIIIADTKMEFGIDNSGTLHIADELLTPDSSRFWDVHNYQVGIENSSYDKQVLRNYLLSINYDKKTPIYLPDEILNTTREKYIKAYNALTKDHFFST